MRGSPAFQVTLRHFGVWRAGLTALLLAAASVSIAWLASWPETPPVWVLLSAAALWALLLAVARPLLRQAPISLRWDGQCWHLGPPSSVGAEPLQGTLAVGIDLGGWMLLRLTAVAPASQQAVWLPVQRRGLEPQWHALRCAVYAVQPMPELSTGP